MAEGIVNQFLCGGYRFLRRNLHCGSGNDFGVRQAGVDQRPTDGVLHQQLLQLEVRLRQSQLLLVTGDGALGAHYLNRRQGADIDLLFGVGQRLLRECQGFVLYPHIFVGED